ARLRLPRLYSSLNRDAARAARGGDSHLAQQLAKEAERIERSMPARVCFAAIKDALAEAEFGEARRSSGRIPTENLADQASERSLPPASYWVDNAANPVSLVEPLLDLTEMAA